MNFYPVFRGYAIGGINERIVIVPVTDSLTRSHFQRIVVFGFGLSALLLLLALLIALRTVHQLDNNTSIFAANQAAAKAAIDEIERNQTQLNANWLSLARRRDVVRREEILTQLAQSRTQMTTALETAYEQAEILRESIYQKSHGLLRWTVWLFFLCVALSLVCASWAVRASAGLFRRLEQQANELAQMQYQFLESQEDVARRFSHELHDELGQALAAIKANLSALRDNTTDAARVNDCMRVVDGAIQDVREMSQLLRPTVLDDFGLDAALHSLAERFSQRTGIEVKYQSTLTDARMPDQTETGLFRIAQEALTNVARHSGASTVVMQLDRRSGDAVLTIRDNGKGFEGDKRPGSPGLGLVGMQTRARGCGGELRLQAQPGKGVLIEVSCPITQ